MTMKTTVNVTCDGENCQHVRAGDANHWLVGVHFGVKGKGVILASNREDLKPRGYADDNLLVKDFCGEECAIKWVSKMLAEIKQ